MSGQVTHMWPHLPSPALPAGGPRRRGRCRELEEDREGLAGQAAGGRAAATVRSRGLRGEPGDAGRCGRVRGEPGDAGGTSPGAFPARTSRPAGRVPSPTCLLVPLLRVCPRPARGSGGGSRSSAPPKGSGSWSGRAGHASVTSPSSTARSSGRQAPRGQGRLCRLPGTAPVERTGRADEAEVVERTVPGGQGTVDPALALLH